MADAFINYFATMSFLDMSIFLTIALLIISFFITAARIISGPTLPDRILGLDMLTAIGSAFLVVIAIKTRYFLYLDIALTLGLVGFLATVAFARFVLHQGHLEKISDES